VQQVDQRALERDAGRDVKIVRDLVRVHAPGGVRATRLIARYTRSGASRRRQLTAELLAAGGYLAAR
jgi:hypothetical protein